MGKFLCTCGNVISDVKCPNEVTGHLLSDKSSDKFFESIASTVQDFADHYSDNRLTEWREKHFNNQYPSDVSPGDMVHDILTSKFMDLTLHVYECDACGRIWIQKKVGVNQYQCYASEDTPEKRSKVLGLNVYED
jgi:hypothetical protein